jgi:hypothetical protein
MAVEDEKIEQFEAWNRLGDLFSSVSDLCYKQAATHRKAEAKIDLNKIAWAPATGPKGAYEKTDDVNSPDYKKLRQELVNHKGVMRLDGFLIWIFENGVVARRKEAPKSP